MSEQQDVMEDFGEAGILDALRWAYISATNRTLDTYSERDGHDAAWLGQTRHTLFCNRLDRVFANDRYAVAADGSDANLDMVWDVIPDAERRTMPRLKPGTVTRSDLNGSPGWAFGDYRLLLAAGKFGQLAQFPWSQKGPTKRWVATQPAPEPLQETLFEDLGIEDFGGMVRPPLDRPDVHRTNLVLAHSIDPLSHAFELCLGRSRLAPYRGGPSWHWRKDLFPAPPATGGRRLDDTPMPPGPSDEPDALVRLRRPADTTRDKRANGER